MGLAGQTMGCPTTIAIISRVQTVASSTSIVPLATLLVKVGDPWSAVLELNFNVDVYVMLHNLATLLAIISQSSQSDRLYIPLPTFLYQL